MKNSEIDKFERDELQKNSHNEPREIRGLCERGKDRGRLQKYKKVLILIGINNPACIGHLCNFTVALFLMQNILLIIIFLKHYINILYKYIRVNVIVTQGYKLNFFSLKKYLFKK